MAYINGNKPIVTNGLVYALDFGNPKSYTSGSNRAFSLIYDPTTNIVTGSTSIPTLVSGILNFTGSQFVQRSGSLEALDPTGSFTISLTALAVTTGSLFSQNLTGKNLGSRITTASSDFGFNLTQGTYSRTIPRTATTATLQHITYRYNSGTIDTFVNGIPVTSSVANPSILTAVATSSLFINSGSNPFSGSLANFYVYNRALTADEIWSNYQLSATRYGFATASNKPYSIDENLYQWIQSTGTTDTNTISAVSTFISGLKSAGLWNKLQVIYPFVGATTGSQTINLKEPGLYRLGLTGSFSASSAGLSPSSSTSYVDSIPGNTVHPLVNSASAHLSLLSYDLPQTSSYPAAIVGGVGAAGGEITYANGKVIHTFRSGSGSFTPVHPSITAVEVLVVAGGGGGGRGNGSNYGGGGGGAGGLIYSSSFSVTPSTAYTTVVGQGGTRGIGSQTSGSNGENSQFATIITIGGGGGGEAGNNNPGGGIGSNGGSGGGGGGKVTAPAANSGSGIVGQGKDGGLGGQTGAGGAGGGGGGAFSTGSFPPSPGYLDGGAPGAGITSSISGIPTVYAQGGRGGFGTTDTNESPGTANTGNGGNGTRFGVAGDGGSGIVIVSYPAIPGNGPNNGFFITETSITGSSNSEFSGGITGSGNIGFLTVSRTGSNSFVLAKNTTQTVVNIAASGSMNPDFYFGAANLAGATSSFGNANIGIAYASIGAGLTTSEVSTYYNLVSQLQTNLKRQNTLLDNYSGSAAAYSLRRIGPSGYFGPAIRVRRDSDNTLRDIGFTSDGQLDTVGLLDFVGVTGSGFVNTWYDQSGNGYNATQATTGSQPLVISSGSVITDNNRNAIRAVNASLVNSSLPSYDYLSLYALTTPLSLATGSSFISYVGLGAPGTYKLFFGYGGSNPATFYYNKGGGTNSSTLSGVTNNKRTLINADANSTNLLLYTDNTLSNTVGIAGVMGGDPSIGIGAGYASFQYPSLHQELILYTSSRRDINTNLNSSILSAYTTGSDTDYQAFITATGITQPTQSAALETLVSDLKSYGLWSKMKAIYPMVTDKNNRFAYSQELNTGWNPVNTVVATNNVTAPDGTLTAERLTETTSSITTYTVTNNGASAYTINGSDNPTLTLERGKTNQFNINASGHPFYIMTGSGAYTAGGQYDTGVTGQGTQVGTLTFVVPDAAPSTLAYVCQIHSSMGGTINVINNTDSHHIYQTISDGLVTGSEYVASIYGKFFNRPWIAMETNTGAKAWFNIQTGVTGSLTGSNATITAVSGGWYRCALYFTSSVASGPQNIQYNLADTNGNLSYAGVAGTGSYLWGAQFENGNVLGPYRATTTVGFTTGSMLDQMKFNLKNPADTDAAFRITYSGSWNGGYSGLKGDGATGTYAATKVNSTVRDLAMNSGSFSVYSRSNTVGKFGLFGNLSVNNTDLSWDGSNFKAEYGGSYGGVGTTDSYPGNIRGLLTVNRNLNTTTGFVRTQKYIDYTYGNPDGTITGNEITTGFGGFAFGYYYNATGYGAAFPYSTNTWEYAFSHFAGVPLSDYESKALYWIVQKYQTTLGRQVY